METGISAHVWPFEYLDKRFPEISDPDELRKKFLTIYLNCFNTSQYRLGDYKLDILETDEGLHTRFTYEHDLSITDNSPCR
jgi:hypothetical protein